MEAYLAAASILEGLKAEEDWVSVEALYGSSELSELHNRAAAAKACDFLTPSHLTAVARVDPGLQMRHSSDGSFQVRRRQRGGSLQLRRALSGVLRYDVADWITLEALLRLLRARVSASLAEAATFGAVFLTLASDPVRYELESWQGQWWARATYRHGSTATATATAT